MQLGDAIILAGGRGKRLRNLTDLVPKPMVEVNDKPFLDYLLTYLSAQRFGRIILSVGYKHEIIRGYFGTSYKGMHLDYVIEDSPLGTGGALKRALREVNGEHAVVLNGDTFFQIELADLVKFHTAQTSVLTIAVKPMQNFDRYGSLMLSNGRVCRYEEKRFRESGYINGGVYVMSKAILEQFEAEGDSFSFERFLETNVERIAPSPFISDGYFIDIGTPEDYRKGKDELPSLFAGAEQ
jgi:D-glycero-alpha-D-manno-heptose 1-phosphate guanylyltransferase